VAAAHAEGARAAVDTSGDALTVALSAGPDLVKPNREELEGAVGRRIETYREAVAAAQTLRDRGARRVLASLGSEGAILVDGETTLHGIAACERVQSTVGAGDALLAGFLAAADAPPSGALLQAVEWAAQSVATPGNGVAALQPALASNGVVTAEVGRDRRLDAERLEPRLLVGEVRASLDGLAHTREE
jgi:1-phosphofructokinase